MSYVTLNMGVLIMPKFIGFKTERAARLEARRHNLQATVHRLADGSYAAVGVVLMRVRGAAHPLDQVAYGARHSTAWLSTLTSKGEVPQ
jgi:hypothetical protein